MFKEVISGSVIIGSAMALSLAFSLPVQAGDCGGNISCACGDSVVASRTLISGKIRDPVLNVVCPGNGLVMNTPGVVLDLNGGKLRGSGDASVGVLIAADNVTVHGGAVFYFGTGVGGSTNESTISAVSLKYSAGDGISLEGSNNNVIDSPARHSGNNGTTVIGDNNTLEGHNNEYNHLHGIYVKGNGNQLIDNKASENRRGGNGVVVIGNNNTIEGSWITKLNTDGIVVQGHGNVLKANLVEKQKRHGIIVDGDDNILTDNKVVDSRGLGISVVGDGDPTASTQNRVAVVEIQVRPQEPRCEIYGVRTPPTCILE